MDKQSKLYISTYNDYYSGMLTKYQSDLIKKYYDEDKSLGEIAEELSITPQAVRDSLKRAEATLEACEEKLGLVKKTTLLNNLLEQLEPVVSPEQKKEIQKALELLNK